MEFINIVLAKLPALFHLSPLDLIVAGIIIGLTFVSHILRVIRMAGEELLEFRDWCRDYGGRWRDE
jgi:hypothetical protein